MTVVFHSLLPDIECTDLLITENNGTLMASISTNGNVEANVPLDEINCIQTQEKTIWIE